MVVVLLSLIVLALMAVFNSTQAAFRASVTQSGVLEGSRAAMDLIAADLREMSPANSVSNGAVNFYAAVMPGATPLVQPLVASGQSRTNVLESIFVLSRDNTTWTGVGYVVNYTSSSPLYPLYRFAMSTNVAFDPRSLFYNFTNAVSTAAWTNMSHLLDGVVSLTARAYDDRGFWLTNGYASGTNLTVKNTTFAARAGEVGVVMYSNTLPASVEVAMGVLEDRALQRAESLSGSFVAQSNYLAQQAGKVHLFRQRVAIPNVDPSAYR